MKSTGITRRIDGLGRIVVPMELRRTLGIEVNDPMEIFVEDDKIIFKKYEAFGRCVVTGEVLKENEQVAGIMLSPKGKAQLLKALGAKNGQ